MRIVRRRGPRRWIELRHRRGLPWDVIQPPLRPSPEVVDAFLAATPNRHRLLVLGVTPEFADLGEWTVAVDHSAVMIERVWPGDTRSRKAILGRWSSLAIGTDSVSAVLGDGSLNVVRVPDDVRPVLNEVHRVLAAGGRAVFRVFCAPEPPETLEGVRRAVEAGEVENVFDLKWRVAMGRVASESTPSIEVERIREAFDATFPDREALSESTGFARWLIDTVDLWDGSDRVYSFPTRSQMLEILRDRFSDVRIVECGHYPLAERCPLFICESRRAVR